MVLGDLIPYFSYIWALLMPQALCTPGPGPLAAFESHGEERWWSLHVEIWIFRGGGWSG